MHECPYCGEACDCDEEDMWHDEAPDDCMCPCLEEGDWDDEDEED